jgi:hypothetical protein
MTQRDGIGGSIGQDIPSLNDTLIRVVDSQGSTCLFGPPPFPRLWAHLWSLNDVCQQAAFALERLTVSVSQGLESPFDLQAKYYLWGFLSRVKTATDLVALILNVVFDLGLAEEACSLEKGKVCGALRMCTGENDPHSLSACQVAVTLDRARNDWVEPFYQLRNLVIHRNGLELLRAPHPETHEYHIFVAPARLSAAAEDRQVVEQILTRIGLVEGPLAPTTAIGPVYLCEQLWGRLATLVDSVLEQSRPQIDSFIAAHRARRDEELSAGRDTQHAVHGDEFKVPRTRPSVSWGDPMRKTLPTWAGISKFEYSGSVQAGTEILYGKKPSRQRVAASQYHALLRHFKGATVGIGTSRTNRTPGSVGQWLEENVTATAIASYVGPILLEEGCAERVQGARSEIRFK